MSRPGFLSLCRRPKNVIIMTAHEIGPGRFLLFIIVMLCEWKYPKENYGEHP